MSDSNHQIVKSINRKTRLRLTKQKKSSIWLLNHRKAALEWPVENNPSIGQSETVSSLVLFLTLVFGFSLVRFSYWEVNFWDEIKLTMFFLTVSLVSFVIMWKFSCVCLYCCLFVDYLNWEKVVISVLLELSQTEAQSEVRWLDLRLSCNFVSSMWYSVWFLDYVEHN